MPHCLLSDRCKPGTVVGAGNIDIPILSCSPPPSPACSLNEDSTGGAQCLRIKTPVFLAVLQSVPSTGDWYCLSSQLVPQVLDFLNFLMT